MRRIRQRLFPIAPTGAAPQIFSERVFASAKGFAISRAHRSRVGFTTRLLGNSSTVERRTLTPLILVRIQVPQPIVARSPEFLDFPVVPDIVLASLAT